MKCIPSMSKAEVLAAIQVQLIRLGALLNHLEKVLPEHEEVLKKNDN